ncbi:hypothetical protein OsJ_02844 [Oryza sativa Japonica Group]|nr:hypothetical protein OsJ_02844 [Oryza sativa Japonica Group]
MSTTAPRAVAERWRELHGEDHWKGLLDPLDADLRRSVIGYGELAQATNDAFIREAWSPHAGACRYSRDRFLEKAQISDEIKRLMDKYKDEETSITVVGHSLGAAVATLNAADIVSNGLNQHGACPVTAVAFACPRVGDSGFRKLFDELPGLRLLRVCNSPDVVPKYPPMGYADVGVELPVDTRRSPYLKSPGNQAGKPGGFKLEVDRDVALVNKNVDALKEEYHVPPSWSVQRDKGMGKRGGFKLEVDRDVALVNKNVDALKEEYHVPPSWSVQRDKGMVRGADGHWKLMDYEGEESSQDK